MISHHQLPIACRLEELCGLENFRFAATGRANMERRRLGWNDSAEAQWIIRAAENEKHNSEFQRWWQKADAVISGVRNFDMVEQRLQNRKLTFYMSERWWKPPLGAARLLQPLFFKTTRKLQRLSRSPFFHFLPIGGFAASDLKWLTSFENRKWQWAYFTETPAPLPSVSEQPAGFKVLWAGRMLKWKCIDTLLKGFEILTKSRDDVHLTIVGDGPEKKMLMKMAAHRLPAYCYRFLDPMPANCIVPLMARHHVYVLASNAGEGWGAVVNEAMSAGCAVIGTADAGASSTLISHMKNGLLFRTGSWRQLGQHMCLLSENEDLRKRLCRAGQRLIVDRWSPTVAATRFYAVCEAIIAGKKMPSYDDGPMAPAWGNHRG